MVKIRSKKPISEREALWDEWVREPMTPSLAKEVLTIHWTKSERNRMHVLAVRNSEGQITSKELAELDSYVNASMSLGILHLRAEKVLRTKGPKRQLAIGHRRA